MTSSLEQNIPDPTNKGKESSLYPYFSDCNRGPQLVKGYDWRKSSATKANIHKGYATMRVNATRSHDHGGMRVGVKQTTYVQVKMEKRYRATRVLAVINERNECFARVVAAWARALWETLHRLTVKNERSPRQTHRPHKGNLRH